MLSSHRLWPRSWSFLVGFILSPLGLMQGGAAPSAAAASHSGANPRYARSSHPPAAKHFRVVSILARAREHGRHALSPDLLDRVQDTQLIIDKNIMLGRITPLDVI